MPNRDLVEQAPTFPTETGAPSDAATPSAEEARVGLDLGRYQVLHPLGAGPSGAVYEGQDSVLERPVALKFLASALLNDPDSLRQVIVQTQRLARLSHPHAVTVYDIVRTESDCCVVMELLNPESVGQVMEYGGPYAWLEATRIVHDCCGALQAAHAAGILHGCLRPSNILFSLSGVAKLVDFAMLPAAGPDGRRSTELSLQAAQYLSPEQVAGWPSDPRSDLYSLGLTYYALLTGGPPFATETVATSLHAQLHSPLPDPRERAKDLDPRCLLVLRKATEKEPSLRYQDAGEMLADLQELLRREDPNPQTQKPPPRSRPTAGWFAAAALILLLALLGEYLLMRTFARSPPVEEHPGPPTVSAAQNTIDSLASPDREGLNAPGSTRSAR